MLRACGPIMNAPATHGCRSAYGRRKTSTCTTDAGQALTDGLPVVTTVDRPNSSLKRTARATRNRQSLSLIAIDLDNFKHINDRAGHGTGDVALRTVADSLKTELRAVDIAARFGG
jgi:diguanylate cyclase (GGDEF)-like protein